MDHIITAGGLELPGLLSKKKYVQFDKRLLLLTRDHAATHLFAIVLDRLESYVDSKLACGEDVPTYEGKVWVRITNEALTREMAIVSEKTIRNKAKSLTELGVLIRDNLGEHFYGRPDEAYYYTIEFSKVDALLMEVTTEGVVNSSTRKNLPPGVVKFADKRDIDLNKDKELKPTNRRKRAERGFMPRTQRKPRVTKKVERTTIAFETKKGEEFLLKQSVFDNILAKCERDVPLLTKDNLPLWLESVAKRMRIKPDYAPSREQDITSCLGSWLGNVTQRDIDNLTNTSGGRASTGNDWRNRGVLKQEFKDIDYGENTKAVRRKRD